MPFGLLTFTPQIPIRHDATIGNFTASGNGYTGTVRTLTLNVKVKIVPKCG